MSNIQWSSASQTQSSHIANIPGVSVEIKGHLAGGFTAYFNIERDYKDDHADTMLWAFHCYAFKVQFKSPQFDTLEGAKTFVETSAAHVIAAGKVCADLWDGLGLITKRNK